MSTKTEDPIITVKRDLQFRIRKLRKALDIYTTALDEVNEIIKEHNHPDGLYQNFKPKVMPARPIKKPQPVPATNTLRTTAKRQSIAELTRSVLDTYHRTEEKFNFEALLKKVQEHNPDATYNNVNMVFNKYLTQRGWDKSHITENGVESFVLIELPDGM